MKRAALLLALLPVSAGAAPLSDVVQIAAGLAQACAVRRDGKVLCWGANNSGAYGDARYPGGAKPFPVPDLTDVAQVNSGDDGACFVLRSGAVRCTGIVWHGSSGGPIRPALLAGVKDAVQVAGTPHHRCLLRRSGRVSCFGDNTSGQLGGGGVDERRDLVDVPGVEGAVEVSAGRGHSCARLASGAVLCWGRRLGFRNPRGDPLSPQLVPHIGDAVSLSSGGGGSCVARKDGSVVCWGRAAYATPGVEQVSQPTRIPGVEHARAVSIAPTGSRTCALVGGGEVSCWGRGALGDGRSVEDGGPVKARGVSDAVQVATGDQVACALTRSGRVLCWGPNDVGEVGRPLRLLTTPAPLGFAAGAQRLAARGARTCAWLRSGEITCWGAAGRSSVPAGALGKIADLAVGEQHSCVIAGAEARVLCWGKNAQRQLGDGSERSRDEPRPTDPPIDGAVALAAGSYHTCARRASGQVLCWGRRVQHEGKPVLVPGLGDATLIAAGAEASFARRGDGSVVRWGGGFGSEAMNPKVVEPFSPATLLGAGDQHACALRDDGRVVCTGALWLPQEGVRRSRNLERGEPRFLHTPGDVRQLAPGQGHACWLRASGGVECWGDNSFGQLGRGTSSLVLQAAPLPVRGLERTIELAAGSYHTCARLGSGAVACWGFDNDGRITTTPPELLPRPVEE